MFAMKLKSCPKRSMRLVAAAALSMGALVTLTSAPTQGLAADPASVQVDGVWARPSIGNTGKSAAYFTIQNKAAKGDVLTAAKGTVSKTIELHTHIKDGEVMRMRRVDGGIEVPANGTVKLQPGGLHVMLIDLTSKLKVGDSFPLTLVFKEAGEVKVDVPVQKMEMRGSGAMETRGSGNHMQHTQ